MPVADLKVTIRTRYIGWAQAVLRVARWCAGVPCVGMPLSRAIYQVCVFQMRCEGAAMKTGWRWVRVPFPAEQKKVSA